MLMPHRIINMYIKQDAQPNFTRLICARLITFAEHDENLEFFKSTSTELAITIGSKSPSLSDFVIIGSVLSTVIGRGFHSRYYRTITASDEYLENKKREKDERPQV